MSPFERRIANTFEDLSAAMQECTDALDQAGIPPDAVFAANLVLEELITNTIKYGYDEEGPREIAFLVAADGEKMTIEIIDDGHPFDPFHQEPPDLTLPIEERPIGGLGLHLVKNTMDEYVYRRESEKNIVRLSKSLAPRE